MSFWYVSKTSDPKEFEELIKYAEQADLVERNEVEGEEVPEEEVEQEGKEDPFDDVTEGTPEE